MLALGLLVNDGCTHAAPVFPTASWIERTANTVRVETDCGSGSGVLVDATHVLTAYHVVDCEDWPAVKLSPHVKIITASGLELDTFYNRFDGERDLAELRVKNPVVDVPAVTVARAYKGELVCATTATPTRSMLCGAVKKHLDQRSHGDFELAGTSVWFGNSGGGVWNAKGELLGLVVRLQWCNDYDKEQWYSAHLKPKKTCGSNMTSIYDSLVMP